MTAQADELSGLVDDAVRGDVDAITALIRLSRRDVRRFLSSMAPAAEIEDLTQETFLRVIRALPGFAGQSTVRTWLFAIARRVAADHARRTSRRPRVAALPDWQTTAESVTPIGTSRFEEQHATADLIAGLPAARRDAFLLTQIAGLSYVEAADVIGCPIGTVRSRVARARDDLITLMSDDRGERRTA